MHRILILADDLSGAADCGTAFAASGLIAVVALQGDAGELDVDVLAVDGDTRRLTPQDAADRTAELMRQYRGENEPFLFKKLDSTLRGNVGAELGAMLRGRRTSDAKRSGDPNPVVAVMAPAFPAQGRTTANGMQLLHGRPLEELEIWKSEGRAGRSHIPEMLQAAGLRTVLLGLATVRSTHENLSKAMLAATTTRDVLVCDAETDDDLLAIAKAGMSLGSSTIWAGSAGLAYHLPKAAGLAFSNRVASPRALAAGPTLFVVGSVSANCRSQVHALSSSSNIVTITIAPDDLLRDPASSKSREQKDEVLHALRQGRDVAVVVGVEDRIAKAGNRHEMDRAKGRMLSSALAQVVAQCAGTAGALVATGGETARAVLQAWGISHLRLIGEVERGLPFSISENWSRTLPVLTKAGDFGDPETLLHCQSFLRDLDRAALSITEQKTGH